MLVSQTLRHFGELDALIRHFVPKPLAPHKASPAPPKSFWTGEPAGFSILKTPAHAAVDAANRLAAADGKAVHFKSLNQRSPAAGGPRGRTGARRNIGYRCASEHAGLAAAALDGCSMAKPEARAIAAGRARQEAPLDITLKKRRFDDVSAPDSIALFGTCRAVSRKAASAHRRPGSSI